MENQAVWFKVLTYFDSKAYFSNGLTIPFLIGAKTIIGRDYIQLTIDTFFSEIIDEHLPKKISIQNCGNIGEYVIGIFDKDSPSGLYRNFGNLYITDDSLSQIETELEIKKIMVERYQSKINDGLFSINHQKWGSYSETDLNRLMEIGEAKINLLEI